MVNELCTCRRALGIELKERFGVRPGGMLPATRVEPTLIHSHTILSRPDDDRRQLVTGMQRYLQLVVRCLRLFNYNLSVFLGQLCVLARVCGRDDTTVSTPLASSFTDRYAFGDNLPPLEIEFYTDMDYLHV